MRSRGNNFSKTEINILLNIIEDVVPIGSEEWKQVETRHRQHYPQLDRSRDTLKRKFRQLYGSRPGTGNPTIPEEVRKAKDILEAIKSKQNVSDGEGSGGSDFESSSSGTDGEDAGDGAPGGGTDGGTGEGTVRGADGGGGTGGDADAATVVAKKGSRGGRASKRQKKEKEEIDLIQYLVLENAKDKAERERNRLEELRHRREDRKAERKENRMMMMLMMGMFGQSQNRSGSVPSGSLPNYLDFANDSSSDESDGKQRAV